MSSKAIKRKAEEHLGYGLSKQQVFDLLMAEHPEAKPKKVAETLRYMPTLHARERHRTEHRILLAAIALSALLRVWHTASGTEFHWDNAYRMIALVPIASLLVGWGLYRWHGQLFQWIGWMNLLGGMALLGRLRKLVDAPVEPWAFGTDVLSVVIGGLALYIFTKVFPKYDEVKDPLGGPKRYVFREDGPGVPLR